MPHAVAVAASGGRDSTALLHATVHAAAALGLQVHALHVHHGLMAEADAWQRHVQAQCRRWARRGLPVHFHAYRLEGSPPGGESVEAWARRGRYAALAEMARAADCTLVLLAHHRRDQAETLLLQALRGGGPAGLAAMPRSAQRQGITWARPWLDRPREQIEAYLQRHRLAVVDDASNADARFARSRLRHGLWPALAACFPDAEPQLHAAARRAAEAAAALQELAQTDTAACVRDARLQRARWCTLSPARRALVLRHWLRQALGAAVPESLVQRLLLELPQAHLARWPAAAGELQLYRGALSWWPQATADTAPTGCIDLSRPGRLPAAGWGGSFLVSLVDRGGIDAARLRQVALRAREGGERFQFAAGAAARSLKKQFQARAVAPWQRQGPLVYDGDTLLFVPGLGVDARVLAAAGTPQVQLDWEPGPSGSCQPGS